MVLSLVACGNGEKSGSKDSNKNSDKNTYETPMDLLMDQLNAKNVDQYIENEYRCFNDLCEKEYRDLDEIFDDIEDYKEEIEDDIETLKYECGNDYKYSYKIEDKEEIDEYDLEEMQDEIKYVAEYVYTKVEIMKEFDWDSLADELEISVEGAKKLVGVMEDVYQKLKNVKVTEGYELTVTLILNGGKMEVPEEWEMTICVYKVNGRWVSEETISGLKDFKII